MMRMFAFLLCFLSAIGCGSSDSGDSVKTIHLWKHRVNNEEEQAEKALFARFNASQTEYRLETQAIPQAGYTYAITVAALAERLPCVLTVDNPKVSSFVWAGYLQPLDGLVKRQTLLGLGEAAKGTFNGRIYSVGQFDAALALFTRKSVLESVKARIPTLDTPWSFDEFMTIMADLKATGQFQYISDMGTHDSNPDWWAYAMSPILQSFGGDLVNRVTYQDAEGFLNGGAALAWGAWFQSLFEDGYVGRKPPDDRGFHKGRVAMAYSGNWWALEFTKIWGEDLLILPPPDFGYGTVIGGGSWQWAISSTCDHPEGAAAFIDFLMQTEEVATIAEVAGMIPVTEAAAELTTRFNKEGEFRVFFDLMRRFAKSRPASPAFVTIANSFTRAGRDIMYDADVHDALDDAADDIRYRIEENGGYRLAQDGAGG